MTKIRDKILSIFQSTPPVKAATKKVLNCPMRYTISIHAAREGGDRSDDTVQFQIKISIHAAREGGDLSFLTLPLLLTISIHAAREGGDAGRFPYRAHDAEFQSTPPVKAATKIHSSRNIYRKFQSTPPVKAATSEFAATLLLSAISIHAAREGGDCGNE